MAAEPHPYWPLFDLRVITPRVTLKLITDDRLAELIDVGRDIDGAPGVFAGPWATLPDPERARSFATFHWACRANWSVDDWHLTLVAFIDDHPVGVQDVSSKAFARLGVVSTGSWLGRRHAGNGIGTEMRSAVLHLAFAGLGAREAHSSARAGNTASLRVSEKLGYEPNGAAPAIFGDDEVAEDQRLRLTRQRWLLHRRDDIEIEGLDACRDMFGLPDA